MPEALGCQERPGCCRREAQEGATEPDTHPADGADVHGLRVVAAVEQPLGLQQHGQTGLRGEEAKLWLQIALCKARRLPGVRCWTAPGSPEQDSPLPLSHTAAASSRA